MVRPVYIETDTVTSRYLPLPLEGKIARRSLSHRIISFDKMTRNCVGHHHSCTDMLTLIPGESNEHDRTETARFARDA